MGLGLADHSSRNATGNSAEASRLRKVKLTQTCKERFLEALAETGSVSTAVAIAGTSRTRVYELRKTDPAFASAWQDAEEIATDRLEDEAKRCAIEGVPKPLVSAGKVVRDDNGQPAMVPCYSDTLLLARHHTVRDRSASNCLNCARWMMRL